MEACGLTTYRFVKGEDLNHHGTLFAGRAAEWFVETGLMTTAQVIPASHIVLVNINQMYFKKPIHLGDVVTCQGRVAHAGRTSFIVNICFVVNSEVCIDGFITYVNTDKNGQAIAHGITLDLSNPEVKALDDQAQRFVKERK